MTLEIMVSLRLLLPLSALAVAAAVSGVFVACSSTAMPPIDAIGPTQPHYSSRGGDAGLDSGSAQDAAPVSCHGADASCNDLNLCGPQVLVAEVARTAPSAAGGAVVPGVYSMTSYTIYTGTGGASKIPGNWFKETFEVQPGSSTGADASVEGGTTSGSSFPWLDVEESDQSPIGNSSGLLVTQGTSLVLQFECQSVSMFPADYTATAASIVLYYDDPQIGRAEVTYTLQP